LKKQTIAILLFSIVALLTGFVIAKIDTSKNWDDTGVTVFLVLGTTFFFSVLHGTKPWLFAFLVAAPIVLLNIYAGNYGSILSFAFAFAGAYIGFLIRRAIRN